MELYPRLPRFRSLVMSVDVAFLTAPSFQQIRRQSARLHFPKRIDFIYEFESADYATRRIKLWISP